jgi:multidrug resistance efflux pump
MIKFSLLSVAVVIPLVGAAFFGISDCWEPDPLSQSSAEAAEPNRDSKQILCTGRVEATGGEIDVSAQIAGQLAEVRVTEGDQVKAGDVIAVIDSRREAALLAVAEVEVALAEAQLERVQAGVGDEEIQEAEHSLRSVQSLLTYETRNLERVRRLHEERAATLDELEQVEQKVQHLEQQCEGLKKRYEALRRGPIAEEVIVAEEQVELARSNLQLATVDYEDRLIRAPTSGTVLEVYRHAGDSVLVDEPSPILRLADTGRLRVRLEIDESAVKWVHPAMEGTFTLCGSAERLGDVVVKVIVPSFGPKRLFNPDTTARVDTRTLAALCEVTACEGPLYLGERVTVQFTVPCDHAGKPGV